jgi:hypothetical protein
MSLCSVSGICFWSAGSNRLVHLRLEHLKNRRCHPPAVEPQKILAPIPMILAEQGQRSDGFYLTEK